MANLTGLEQIKGRLDAALLHLGGILEIGGTRKDAALIVISAVALLLSFLAPDLLPFDPGWVAVALCGAPIVIGAAVALITEFDIKADVLVSMALIASLIVGEIFAAGEVALIMQLGSLLEQLTVRRAREGIERLVGLAPTTARVVDCEGCEQTVAADDVRVGDLVRVLPGEAVPVDGTIVSGATSINQAIVTGEALPCDLGPGDEVLSGTVNQFGSFDMRATHVGQDSSVQRLVALVQSADAGKARIVNIADRWATWIVVGALAAAALTWIVTGEILRAVTILVVFCPCALVLATPTAIMAGIGNATKHGFLVREGDALERLAMVDRFAFDKTGTLTHGTPEVVAVVPHAHGDTGGQMDADRLLRLAAIAEKRSEHPLGRAIVRGCMAKGSSIDDPDSFEMLPGLGVRAEAEGARIAVGNARLVEAEGSSIPDFMADRTREFLDQGCTIAHVSTGAAYVGFIALADTLRADAGATVAGLLNHEARPVLLTGDNEQAARSIAGRAGIEEVVSRCLPADKLAYIERAEAQGHKVCMVGDGINDAPALKRSFVGVALGAAGSDLAVDAADIALVDDAIGELPHLLALSRHMMRVIRANLTFSMALNFIAVTLAITAVLNPVTGALVHNCGSVFVIVNSALLLRWRAKR